MNIAQKFRRNLPRIRISLVLLVFIAAGWSAAHRVSARLLDSASQWTVKTKEGTGIDLSQSAVRLRIDVNFKDKGEWAQIRHFFPRPVDLQSFSVIRIRNLVVTPGPDILKIGFRTQRRSDISLDQLEEHDRAQVKAEGTGIFWMCTLPVPQGTVNLSFALSDCVGYEYDPQNKKLFTQWVSQRYDPGAGDHLSEIVLQPGSDILGPRSFEFAELELQSSSPIIPVLLMLTPASFLLLLEFIFRERNRGKSIELTGITFFTSSSGNKEAVFACLFLSDGSVGLMPIKSITGLRYFLETQRDWELQLDSAASLETVDQDSKRKGQKRLVNEIAKYLRPSNIAGPCIEKLGPLLLPSQSLRKKSDQT